MDFHKMIIVGVAAIALSTSCSESDKKVSQSKYDALVEECNELKQLREETLASSEENARLIDAIFGELQTITGRTESLQRDVEHRRGSLTKAEAIASDLKTLKNKINKLDTDKNKGDKQFEAVVNNLKSVIKQQESEISNLKNVIRQKDEKITELDNNLSSTTSKLNSTSEQLNATTERLLQAQKQNWVNIGDRLVESANELPDVKGHGNMKPVKQAKLAILKNAMSCYQKAIELGNREAKSKLNHAQGLYNTAKNR